MGTLVCHGDSFPMTIEEIVYCAAEVVLEHGNYNYYSNNCQTWANNFIKKICVNSTGTKLGMISDQKYIIKNASLIDSGNISINYSQIEKENQAKFAYRDTCVAILSVFYMVFLGVWWISLRFC